MHKYSVMSSLRVQEVLTEDTSKKSSISGEKERSRERSPAYTWEGRLTPGHAAGLEH